MGTFHGDYSDKYARSPFSGKKSARSYGNHFSSFVVLLLSSYPYRKTSIIANHFTWQNQIYRVLKTITELTEPEAGLTAIWTVAFLKVDGQKFVNKNENLTIAKLNYDRTPAFRL